VPDDLSLLDGIAQADLVRNGDATPLELVDAAISRVEKLDPELNAVIHPLFEKARAAASEVLPDGPLRGVPMVVKDFACHTAGDPFCEGFAFLKRIGWIEPEDTYLAAKFRAAGLVFIGHTNTPESGILPTTEPHAFGPTHNPWDTSRSTGGSSGGSAAAVASGMVPIGHANDGGGSIRIPASECGLVGLKPTRARVSIGPEFGDVMSGLVCELAVTRTVRDTAVVLDAVEGPMPGDPYGVAPPPRPYAREAGADPGRLRVGLLTQAPGGTTTVNPDCVNAAEGAARLLESLGHSVEPAYPVALDEPDFTPHFITLWSGGNAWILDYWSRRTGQTIAANDVEPLTWALAEMGRSFTSAQYLGALEYLQAYSRRVASWWAREHFDLLLTPTIAEPPPLLGEFEATTDNPLAGLFRAAELVPFTPPFNVTGQPAISLPLHWNEVGLPIGVQLVAAFGREDLLLRVAAQLEGARPWINNIPPVHA
jgi:amidase